MKRILILLLQVIVILKIDAEELVWFSLDCNLRNADVIIQAEIIDNKGNLKIEKYYKGQLNNQNEKWINLNEFAINKKEKKRSGFPKEKGKSVMLFINLGFNSELKPAFLGWNLSTLWLNENKYWGVIQRENPGGYELYPYYKNETDLKLKIDNWIFLENLIIDSKNIEPSSQRINYLIELFNWHPFKEDILEKLSEEENIDSKIIENLIWKIFTKNNLSKSELYPCGLMDYKMDNYYQLTFKLYKKIAEAGYEKNISAIITSYKNHVNYMERRESSDFNEDFILEITKFLNENPPKNWEQEKVEINAIINENEKYYNNMFLISIRNEMSAN